MRSESTGKVVPAWCGSRRCKVCAKRLEAGARHAIVEGIRRTPEGHAPVLLTITQDPHRRARLDGFWPRWKRTQQAMRRRDWLAGYAAVCEPHRSGVLHGHVTCWMSEAIAELLDADERQALLRNTWRGRELIPFLVSHGWGQVAHAVRIRSAAEAVGSYLSKSLDAYVTKNVAALGRERIRPVNLSRGWYDGGLTRAQIDATLRTPDAGPWRTLAVRAIYD